MKIDVKKLLKKCLLWIVSLAIFIVGYYFVYLYCGYQREISPATLEITDKTEEKLPLGEEVSLMTFNIGFGAYSDDYSFFMDGGEYSRALSLEAVYENMDGIIGAIKENDPDILLLQEIDIKGTRSYNVDQTELVLEEMDGYDSVMAINYNSPYYLYPLREPIGKNKSGIMTLSRYNIAYSTRWELPVEDSLYKYLDLDRAYSVSMISTGGASLMLYNIHLSAYTEDGSIADEQLKLLLEDMTKEYEKGRYVIAAGDFNKDLLGDSSLYFEREEMELAWAKPINTEFLPEGINLYAASNVPSCRNANKPYKGDGTDFVLTVDGMLASANVTVVSSETLDEGFKHSDHNPVKYTIILEKPN